mmetsp:Transcript_22722/g.62744  ORF Transcript_22722/g.62744 Transcript_22722/m.62744 type:complete len:82 (+) Transcript_22722:1126-1371(+)
MHALCCPFGHVTWPMCGATAFCAIYGRCRPLILGHDVFVAASLSGCKASRTLDCFELCRCKRLQGSQSLPQSSTTDMYFLV